MASPLPPPLSTPLAPGFRFHPTDEELVAYYLRRRAAGLPLRVDAIAEVDLYKQPPWGLPSLSRLRSRDREWFFFCVLDRKYDCSLRANRATTEGFWKSTGKDRPVILEEKRKVIGMKKSLVFHVGRAPNGKRTNWVMHEYRLLESEKNGNGAVDTAVVVCRVFLKSGIGQHRMDQYGGLLPEEEGFQSLVPADVEGEAGIPDGFFVAAGGEQDDRHSGHSDDLEGTTERKSSINRSTVGNEASSSISKPLSNSLLAPGFRFHPTDEELVSYYLKRKVSGLPLHADAIAEVNIYKWAPWDLPPMSRLSLSVLNSEWYFFSCLDRKYAQNRFSHHNNRATAEGYWKSTGNDRPVRSSTEEKIVGMKKTLVFHSGRAPGGQRTDWVMHEYRLEEDEPSSTVSGKGSFVICRIYQKTGSGPRKARNLYGAPFVEDELEEEAKPDMVPSTGALPAKDATDSALSVDLGAADSAPDVNTEVADSEQVHSSQGPKETMYRVGSQVEIAYLREKVPVAWYRATVVEVVDERILSIEYDNVKAEDGTLVSEVVSTQYIRPHPPPASKVENFNLLDEVEAFYNGGWWPGVVAKVNADSRYNIKFMHWEEEIEFKHTELRLLYDWVDGQWIQASQDKSIESQNLGGQKLVGNMQTPPSNDTCTKGNIADSTNPLNGIRDEAPSELQICALNYEYEDSDGSTSQSQPEDSQPCKKAKKEETMEDNVQLCNSGGTETGSTVRTGFDVHTPIIEEEPTSHTKALVEKCRSASPCKEINVGITDSLEKPSSVILSGETNKSTLAPDKPILELSLFHKSLGTEGDKDHNSRSGKRKFLEISENGAIRQPSLDSQQDEELVSELDHQGDKGVRQHPVGEKRRKSWKPQMLTMIEPSFEGDSMGNQQSNKLLKPLIERLSTSKCGTCSDNGSEARPLFHLMASSSDAASSIQPSDTGNNALQNVLHSSAEQSASEKAKDSPSKQSLLPFKRCSFMWDSVESMEVFQVMPQQPHFRPLDRYCEEFREGIAIGLMVTFSNMVKDIDKLQISDSRCKFDVILKILEHLEEHGFDVQCARARLEELLKIKDTQGQLVDKMSAIKTLIGKEKREKQLLDLEIGSVGHDSKGPEVPLTHSERPDGISEQKRANSLKLDRLEMNSKRIEDALSSAELDFKAIRSAVW